MSRLSVVAVVAALALVLAGCSTEEPEFTVNDQVPAAQRTEDEPEGAPEGGAVASDTTFVAADILWESAPSMLPAGDVELTLENIGQAPHTLVIEGVGGDEPILMTQPGETNSAMVTLEPGTYRYFCNVPGHEALMNGMVTVG